MAEKHRANGDSPERAAMVASASPSKELTSSGSDLHSLSIGRGASSGITPNNLSSITVPVRLDVLYFLINSAARGAQCALPHSTGHGALGSFSRCPSAQPTVNCFTQCSCHSVPACAGFQQQSCSHQRGSSPGGFGGHGGMTAGVRENQNTGQQHLSSFVQRRNDGHSWSGPVQPNSLGGWKRAESSGGYRENWQGEGRGRDHGGNWQGKWQNAGRSLGNRRQGGVELNSWRSGSQGWKRDDLLESSFSNGRRNQEGNRRQVPWDTPETQRSFHGDTRKEQQASQGRKESTNFLGTSGSIGVVKAAAQEEEDWEVEYASSQATNLEVSHPSPPGDQSDSAKTSQDWGGECASPSAGPSKVEPGTNPLPESACKAQAPATKRKPAAASNIDWSKNGGFIKYLKNLYPDQPRKASSESSLDLVIDTDTESSKPSEEEQSVENAAVAEELALLEQSKD